MTGLVGFVNGGVGRAARVVLGVGLVYWGIAILGGTTGAIVAVVGLVPLALGLVGRCLLEPLAPSAQAESTRK